MPFSSCGGENALFSEGNYAGKKTLRDGMKEIVKS